AGKPNFTVQRSRLHAVSAQIVSLLLLLRRWRPSMTRIHGGRLSKFHHRGLPCCLRYVRSLLYVCISPDSNQKTPCHTAVHELLIIENSRLTSPISPEDWLLRLRFQATLRSLIPPERGYTVTLGKYAGI